MKYIKYTRGGGGNWLSFTIAGLEHKKFDIPPAQINFHDSVQWPKCHAIGVSHREQDPGDYIFSTHYHFNVYINFWKKHLQTIDEFAGLSPLDQFRFLSNDALYRFSSEYDRTLVTRIDLKYEDIWQDEKLFTKMLFVTLADAGVEFERNEDFVLASADRYRATCPKPQFYLRNYSSLPWLAWCHAQLLRLNIQIPFQITDENIFSQMSDFAKENDAVIMKQTFPAVLMT